MATARDVVEMLLPNSQDSLSAISDAIQVCKEALLLLDSKLRDECVDPCCVDTSAATTTLDGRAVQYLARETIFYICSFVDIKSVIGLRLSSNSLHLMMMECPVSVGYEIIKEIGTYEVVNRYFAPIRWYKSLSLNSSTNISKGQKKGTLGQERYYDAQMLNFENQREMTLELITVCGASLHSIHVTSFMKQRNLSGFQIKSLGFDYAWEIINLTLNNDIDTSKFENMLLKLCGFHQHCFLKKLEVGVRALNILEYIGEAHAKGLLPFLEEISFHIMHTYDRQETDIDLGNICHLKNIETLKVFSLADLPITSKVTGNLQYLENVSMLQDLDLDSCDVNGDLGSLSYLVHLKTLSLSQTDVRGDVQILSSLKNLEYLDISRMYYTHGDLTPCIDSWSNLQFLYMFSTNATCTINASFSKLARLKFIDMSDNHGITGNIEHLSNLKNLRSIQLSQTKVKGSISVLVDLKNLNALYLHGSNVDPPDLKILAHYSNLRDVFNNLE